MYRIREIIAVLATAVALALPVWAAGPYEDYIDEYWEIAVDHQAQYGIPASITLAQGLLESAAGRSRLAAEGNNHFGIKCHKGWKGKSMRRNDDAPNECFRAYNTPGESYEDHARFLQRDRYSRLFKLDVTDYQGWARGLRECGYATDPQYAARLITIIERYSLYRFDTEAGRDVEETVAFIAGELTRSHPVRKNRGLHYVIANPGDTYGQIAKEFGIKKKTLLKYNDVKKDGEVKEWGEVYLQEKPETAPDDAPAVVTIGEGESMHSLAQRFGMRLDAIKKLNKKAKDKEGTEVKLR